MKFGNMQTYQTWISNQNFKGPCEINCYICGYHNDIRGCTKWADAEMAEHKIEHNGVSYIILLPKIVDLRRVGTGDYYSEHQRGYYSPDYLVEKYSIGVDHTCDLFDEEELT